MKKNIQVLMSLSFCLLFTTTRFSAWAQQKRSLTPEELKQWNIEPVEENILSKIPAAEKEKAADYARAIAAYTIKSVLHQSDPANYPMDETEDSPQKIISASLKNVSPYTFNKMKEKAMLIIADPSKRSAVLGKFKNIDFKKRSIHSDIQKITPIKLQPGAMMKNTDDASLQAADFYKPQLPEKNSFSKMDFVLRKVHCVDETNPESGDDDIVLGGLKVGCSGNAAAGKSVASCHFDDNDFCDHGAVSLGGYSLNACTGYPKTFYFFLQLLEVDSDQEEAAQALTDLMEFVEGSIAGTGNCTDIACVAETVEVLCGLFFDPDNLFPLYGIKLTLTDPTAFGSDGRSANKRTGNISAHGGIYRVGYYWQKRN